MRKIFIYTSILVAAVSVTVIACTSSSARKEKPAGTPTNEERIKRGEYLVSVVGCDDCHSPKRMGAHGPEIIPELRLSGFNQASHLPPVDTSEVGKGWMLLAGDLTAAVGPWGVSYAANLTSDATGLGELDRREFLRSHTPGKIKRDCQ